MGVKRAWPFLRKQGLAPDSQHKVSLTSPLSKIRIDVCSTHNTPIRYIYSGTSDLEVAHSKLEQWLLKIGSKESMRLYIDGMPAAEKEETHASRHQVRQKALIKAAPAISNLEARLAEKKRVRKHHISSANKLLRQAFHWSLENRKSFVEYMTSKNYDIVLCPTESDVLIAAECQPQDAVISCDSDLLFYKTIPVVWRPMGSYKARRFVPYERNAILEALDLSSSQLTALAILSGNDYAANIPHLAIHTNHKIVSTLTGDEKNMIQQYLAHPNVKRRTNKEGTWTTESYANAVRVFVDLKQDLAINNDSARDPSEDSSLSYTVLRQRMETFTSAFKTFKAEEYKARVAKRDARNAGPDPNTEVKPMNPFATIDKPAPSISHQYRPRYSPKIRYEPHTEQPAPAIMMQYTLKPWKEPELPEKPSLPEPAAKKPTPIKPEIRRSERFERKQILDALSFEHPTVTLDLDRLSTNVRAAVHGDPLSKTITECIRGAVKVAWETKRRCQILIGLYLEDLFYPRSTSGNLRPAIPVATVSEQDQAVLNSLCPPLASKEMTEGSDDVSSAEDGQDDGSNTPFIHSLLSSLYSGNRPGDGKVGSVVNAFISRLQRMGHLGTLQSVKTDLLNRGKDYAPSFLVRSVASQLSAELRRHYRHGAKKLSEQILTLIKKGQLASNQAMDLKSKEPAIQLFVRANALAGRRWRLSPLSSEEHGYMTFTESELAAFLHKRDELHPVLKELIGFTDQQRRLTQVELTQDWLPLQTPGLLIQQLIAPVDPRASNGDRLHGRQKKNAGVAATIKIVTPEDLRMHVNSLRHPTFDPRTYEQKGYFLRGSIKTDGYNLQLLAYKVRELNSVKYKRYSTGLLPNRLLNTTSGTSDFLTEVRNVFKTAADVELLLGCTLNETDKVSYLGIDPGQAYIVGAYAHLAQDMNPKIGKRQDHRRKKMRGSRGRGKRGSGKSKKTIHQPRGQRHINLAANQKAVAQPTLRHRNWMEKQKGTNLLTTNTETAVPPTVSQPATNSMEAATPESLSICTIESSLPPLHGATTSFADHVEQRRVNHKHLDTFYNGKRFRFKKYKRMSKKARAREFHQLADSLLRMVGGTTGEKRKEKQKVVIGIGLGSFMSSSGLSSLHGTFESYFIQKARALGYLVVGINEYYSSKKCPKCEQFVAQSESIRRLYCCHCKKFIHRDVMAAHNMVNILRAQVEKQERPLYLQPVDKDGNYPWLESEVDSDDKCASSTQDTPDPPQQAGSGSGRAGLGGRKRKTAESGNADNENGSRRIKATVAKRMSTMTKGKSPGQASSDGIQGQGSNRNLEKSTSTNDMATTLEADS
ncbi:hypothetical protein BGZ83_001203 [Gryganskiella cystojenkinii]|nr:hypothetical protein BGZ83_001203 [Gryganskiella cystojenkinii]